MNRTNIILGMICLSAVFFTSCGKDDNDADGWTPETYIIISDMHLGDQRSIDDGYGCNLHMKDTLVAFLDYVRSEDLCDKLIVAGDMIDEWVAPPDYPTFADRDGNILTEQGFFKEVVKANRSVFDSFQELKNDGVELVYIPGDHDMQLTSDDFTQVIPGLFTQARSAGVDGMGEYRPDQGIFIEHGHRYDIMNAPYLGKNGVDGIAGSILPPGFFMSRLGCGYRMGAGRSASLSDDIAVQGDTAYNMEWTAIGALFGRKDVATMTDGMTRTYTFDEYAYNTSELFYGIDDREEENDGWSVRSQRLGACFEPTVAESLLSGLSPVVCDRMGLYLLENTTLGARILVWGHNHSPKLYQSSDGGEERVYVNTGCWVDGEVCGSGNNSTFCKITKTRDKEYLISLCRFVIDGSGKRSVDVISETMIQKDLDGCRIRR